MIGPVGDRVEQLFFLFDAADENEGCRKENDKDANDGREGVA